MNSDSGHEGLAWYDWLGLALSAFFWLAAWQVFFGVAPSDALLNMIGVASTSGVAFYIGYRISKEY
jgi:hypothetical protein